RPLAFYGWLEVAIGIYALAFPQLYEIAYGVYLGAAKGAGGSSLLAMKFFMALVVVIIPTVLMGGTLPVLTRLLTRSLGELRGRVSTLYFINSVGAVLGVGLAEFWLVPDMGLDAAIYCGAVLNLGVGAIALFVSGWLREEKQEEPSEDPSGESTETFTREEIRLAVIGIGLSGFAAMLYEIAWTRLLGLTMGSTSGAFAIMLMTFISGIALGSWLIGRIKKISNSLDWFAWMEIAVGASVILTMFLYSRLPYWFICLATVLKREASNYGVYQLLEAIFSFGVMIIPTTILGMTLPLVSRISTAELARTGRSVGHVFSFNTIGAVVGTIITGLWALPTLGLARTFALGTGINIAIGIVILARNAAPAQKKLVPMVLPGVVLWAVLAHSLFDAEWQRLTTSGAYRYKVAPESFEDFDKINKEYFTILYHRDGAGSTVTVKRDNTSQEGNTFLLVNGKTDASTVGDMSTQLLIGHMPALLHPDPKEVLVIGLGSGATAGAMLTHTNVQSVVSVEISPEIVAVADQFFASINNGVMKNPKHSVLIDDAKSYLHTTEKTFDIIVSQPSNPWMAGIPGLYSSEYYQQCARKMKPGGLMCQWVQQYEIGKDAIETILATFTLSFPHTTVWCSDTGNLLLLGSTTPLDRDVERFVGRLRHQPVQVSLAHARIGRPLSLLAHELISPEYARYAFPRESTQIHSDYFPVLDRMAQVGRFVGRTTQDIFRYDERKEPHANSLLGQYLKNTTPNPYEWNQLYQHNEYVRIFGPEMIRSFTSAWAKKYPKDPRPTMFAANEDDARAPTVEDVALMSFKLS
ncbi:MAG: methyltransferase domain-containing protein, partial [Limisphaerales bacterium]